MPTLISFPIFIGVVIFQSGVLSRMPLLQGQADLVLLVLIAWSIQEKTHSAIQWAVIAGLLANLATALPFGTLLIAYLLIAGISLVLKRRIWKAPILAMLATTFIGSIILNIISYISVTFQGIFLPIVQVIERVILPTLLLNILLAIPVYILIHDLAEWMHPEEIEV